jgi:hypothetical protein
VPIQAWIDDSGAKGQGGYLVLGGLIGVAEEWAAFSDEWARQLAAHPTLRYLSTSDAAIFGGQFRNWPVWQRDTKIRRLAATVKDFDFTLIFCAVDLAAYDELFPRVTAPRKGKAVKRLKTLSEQPYFLCFHSICTSVCADSLKRGVTERIELMFDEQDMLAPRMKDWYPVYLAALTAHERAIMPIEPLFRDDKEFMPLQVADLIAWVVRADLGGEQHAFRWVGNEMRGLNRSPHCQVYDNDY